MNTRALRAAALTTVPAALVAALLVSPPATAQAAAKANLKVTKATVDKTTVVEGDELTVTHTVQNRGRRKAGASTTRVYLTTDVAGSLAERRASHTDPRSSVTDLRLDGAASIKSLAPGAKRTSRSITFTVPVGLPAGDYKVLVCVDDHGKVKESDEGDNCTAATKPVTITEVPGSEDLSLQTFADTFSWPDDESSALQFVKIFCKSTYPVKSYSLTTALKSTQAFLEDKAPGGIEQLRSSGLVDTAEEAQNTAAAAVTGGSPGLALAALLEAYRLQPSRGTHLVNAAAIATSVGLPNQALAFLDAAVGKDFLRTPLGIPHEATAAVVRGQALVMTGRLDAGERLFTSAKRLAPILSEADAGLATVAACKGKDAIAARYIRRSRQRSDEEVPTTPPTEEPVRPDPEIDITRGEEVPLRQLPLAQTPSQGVDMYEVYDGIAQGFFGEIDANNKEYDRIRQHLRDTDDARTPAEIDRREGLLTLLYRAGEEGEVETAYDALVKQIDKLVEHNEEFFGGGTGEAPYTYGTLQDRAFATCEGSQDPNCFDKEIHRTCVPALTSAHNEWVSLMRQAQTKANTYFRLLSKRMTGVAANLLDEEAQRLGLVQVEALERSTYAFLVQQGQHWTLNEKVHRDHCVDDLPPEILNPPADVTAASPGLCEGPLKAIKVKATLGPTSLSVNCEKIEQGFSQEIIPLLHVFVDVKFDFRTGNVSVWAGVKGGGKLPGGIADASFKSGIYVKVDQRGDLVDTGWRVGPTANVAGGKFGAFKDEIDLSFTSSLTPGY